MNRVIDAVIENGLLRPDSPLELPSGTRVRLTLEPLPAAADDEEAWQELEKLWDEIHIDSGGQHLTRDQMHERR